MDIVERLRETMRVEWRVVNIVTEGTVIWFGSDYIHPEHEARKWLKEHADTHKRHEVRRAEVFSPLHVEAASELTRLRAEVERLQRIAFLIGSIYAHGDFKAETINEHELEQQLRLNGTFWTTPQEVSAYLSAQDAALSPSTDGGGADSVSVHSVGE